MADNKQLAASVLEAVGGPDNVNNVAHCFTRLRFTLKDDSVPNDDEVKKIPGVLGVAVQGGQYQVVIGPKVPEVYDAVVALGVEAGGEVDENLDAAPAEKKPLTPKQIGANILDYISGTVIPLIPILITGALFKTLTAIFGPTFLNLVPADSAFTVFCNTIYNAAFYFMPIIAGASAAKKLGVNSFLGALVGAALLEPGYAALATTEGATFSVFGLIDAPTLSYGSSLIPALLSVYVMSLFNKFFNKVVHESVRTVFAPFLTMVCALPLTYLFLAPLGNYMGEGVGAFFNFLANSPLYPVAVGLLGGTWGLLVITGMHLGIAAISLAQFAATGQDNLVLLAANLTNFVATACGIAAWVRMKNKEEKNLTLSYIITQCFGGVGEPLLFGVFMKYPRTWLGTIAGGFTTGFLGAILGVICYAPAQGFFSFLDFVGGAPTNFPFAILSMIAGLVVAFLVTYFFGFSKEELEEISKK